MAGCKSLEQMPSQEIMKELIEDARAATNEAEEQVNRSLRPECKMRVRDFTLGDLVANRRGLLGDRNPVGN